MSVTARTKLASLCEIVCVTPDAFRFLALAHRGVVEGQHHGHPDFRVNGKVVASLRPAAAGKSAGLKARPTHRQWTAMVKVSPAEQAELIREHPDVFELEAGAWGRQGCTRVHLAAADPEVVGPALTMAVRARR